MGDPLKQLSATLRRVLERELSLGNRVARVEREEELVVFLERPLHLPELRAEGLVEGLSESEGNPDVHPWDGLLCPETLQELVGPVPEAAVAGRREQLQVSAPAARQAPERPPVDPEAWLLEAVRFFRELGFYAARAGRSDRQVASALRSRERARLRRQDAPASGAPFDPAGPHPDLDLLRWDEERVWWEDTESDVAPGNGVYVATFRRWAAISRGAFRPRRLREEWTADGLQVDVRFELDGAAQRLTSRDRSDYLDLGFLRKINRLVQGSGYRFELHAAFDQTAFVTVLTAAEKRRLTRERGWRFQ